MAPSVEITDRKRRIVLDWVLVGAVVACLSAFFDLRATVKSQTDAFEQVSRRPDGIESREQAAPGTVATKADIARLETRIDKVIDVLMQDRRTLNRGVP
jgi:hypothetical protein